MYSFLFRSIALCALASSGVQALPQSQTSTSTAPATTHTVSVGQGNFQYRPNVTFANPGDTILFQFYPTNHSVTRAEYGQPCIPYEMTGQGKVGFYSGHFLVDKQLNDPPSWSLLINDTDPIWFYCTAIDSCTPHGMVGAINPARDQSIFNQADLAHNAPFMLVPGQPFPSEGDVDPDGNPTDSSSSSDDQQSGDQQSSDQQSGGSHGLSGGAIGGIVVGAIAGVALVGALLFFIGKNRVYSDWARSSVIGPKSFNAGSSAASEPQGASRNDLVNKWASGVGKWMNNGPGDGNDKAPESEVTEVQSTADQTNRPPGTEHWSRDYFDLHAARARSPPLNSETGPLSARMSPDPEKPPVEAEARELVELSAGEDKTARTTER